MSPGTVTAIAYLISEAVAAGVSISTIITEAKEQGNVPEETWNRVLDDLDDNVKAWKSK